MKTTKVKDKRKENLEAVALFLMYLIPALIAAIYAISKCNVPNLM